MLEVLGDNERVSSLNDAQIWTMIGTFAALMVGMLTLISTVFVRVVRSEIGGLRGEMNGAIGGLRGEMRAEIGGLRAEMNARFDTVDARFDTVNARMNNLDRDVQALVKRTFGLDRE